MVEIKPLKGLRYNTDKIGIISEVLAPPYDIISSSQNEELKESNIFNFSFLTLPEASGQKNKYENANDIFARWISEEVFVFENVECLYLIEELFVEGNIKKSFSGIVGLLKVEEYGKGKVLRHEKTLPKPKEDRLNLLKACRANFEFIYTLYDDNDKKISVILKKYKDTEPLIETCVQYDDSLKFKLWRIDNEDDIKSIKDILKPKSILIADGHHRYETSRYYNEMTAAGTHEQRNAIRPEEYILSFFVAGNQEDILIHPTHRLIDFEKKISSEDFLKEVEKYFMVESLREFSASLIENKIKRRQEADKKKLAVCFNDKKCFVLTLKDSLENIYDKLGILNDPFDMDFEYLDVNILHKLILENLLDDFSIKKIKYVHTVKEALAELNGPGNLPEHEARTYDVCFVLNAPSIDTVEKLSFSGQIMPQKSTYFYPKPCSGLVVYKMNPL